MSELTPPGCEAEFYSLYELTDKGSSWIGPLVFGAIYNATGRFRDGWIFLAAMFVIAIPPLFWVDVARGREAAKKFRID